jgi:hypothetical protein
MAVSKGERSAVFVLRALSLLGPNAWRGFSITSDDL